MNEIPQAERELLAGAERRMGWFILGLLPIGAAVAFWLWNGAVAAAFAVGGVLAYLNYRWIVTVVDTMQKAQKVRVRKRDYLKLFGPIALLGAGLYVIFFYSLLSFAGIIGGLLLLVPAVFLEALYQMIAGVR